MNKAERTRQFIIEKAAPIINQKGMAGTSLSDIMEATGLAKGCLYGNFKNKDEICLEAFNYLVTKYAADLDHLLGNYPSATEKLFAYLDFYRKGKFREEHGGCPILNFGAEADDTNPVVKERVKQAIQSSQQNLKNMLTLGIARGEFHPDLDAGNLSLKFYAMLEGAVLISRISTNNTEMEQITDLIKEEINSYRL
ncbi:TetR/AcrR family transcriptional regulator [Gaoshiqia sp. Z1-71]|uniref:TetR/AcrR family transcriptional regulator n=1 Tax=Gaoshiqia hydrogeniformans TaxID=3290090 RepID=UPI003BF8BABD